MPRARPSPSLRWFCITGATFAALLAVAHLLAAPLTNWFNSVAVSRSDRAAWEFSRLHASSTLTACMTVVSNVHGTMGILVLSALGAWGWQRHGHAIAGVRLLIAVPVGMLLNVLVKGAIHRLRPDWALVALPLSYSFPSGHVAEATVFYGSLALEAAALGAGQVRRLAWVVGAIAMVALVASSRVILGVHFLSDCIGAVVEAIIWLAACFSGPPLRADLTSRDAP